MDQTAEWAWNREFGESAFSEELPRYIKERKEKLKSNLGKAQILKDYESELLIRESSTSWRRFSLWPEKARRRCPRVIADSRISIRENW